MISSELQCIVKKENYHISWERMQDHIMLTDTLFQNQLVFVDYHYRREIVLFDIVTGSIKPMPGFGKCICSGVIFKTELYVLIFENEDSDDDSELWWRPIYGCYKINLEDLVTWVLCESINNHFQRLYGNMDSGSYGQIPGHYDNNYGEQPRLHKCGEDLFISSHNSFLSYNFKTDRARFFEVPEGYEEITAMAVVNQKIYMCADYNHKLCEVNTSEGVYKDITLQENITDTPDYFYADTLSDVSCDVQDINHLKVYRNRYILLNYTIHNFNLHLCKWRFLIYDTKLGTVDSSPFYRSNLNGPQICYGLWVEDSFFFYEYHRGKDNSTTIFSIQEIIGNYKTIDTWILVKNLVDRKLVDLTTVEEGIEKRFMSLSDIGIFQEILTFLSTKSRRFLRDRLDETEGDGTNPFFMRNA